MSENVSGENKSWWDKHWEDWEKLEDKPHVTCPECGKTSYNLNDVMQGYCGNCNKYTSQPNAKNPEGEDSGDERTAAERSADGGKDE